MEKSLTHQQKKVLNVIKDLMIKLGKPPTLDEIRKASDLNYISSVQRHVGALKDKGYLDHVPNQSRSLQPSYTHSHTINIPLIGNVAAGTPILAIENIEAYIPYEPTKVKANLKDYFFLRAVGDSMNMADVNGSTRVSGVYVLLRRQSTGVFGQIVVALMGEDSTIKKYINGDGHIVLQPLSSNPTNKPIYVFDDFLIQGIVVDVIKREVLNA